jgi:hypothetical protein
MHFWLAAERQIAASSGEPRADPLPGCDQREVTRRLFETIWRVDQDARPRLEALLARLPAGKDVRRLITLEALDALAAAGL